MSQTNQFRTTSKLTHKDVAELLGVEQRAGKQYLTDIKRHHEVKTVLYCHFCDYFKIPANYRPEEKST